MKTLAILAIAGALTTSAVSLNQLLEPITPTALRGNQCNKVCDCGPGTCTINGAPQTTSCLVGTKSSTCCDYCQF